MQRLLAAALALPLVPAASGAKAPNACRLLTNKEVSQALRTRIADRHAQKSRVVASCDWNGIPINRYTSSRRSLRMWVQPMSERAFRNTWTKFGTPVRGIGEPAFATNTQMHELAVWKRGYFVAFNVTLVALPLRTEKALAKQAIRRL